MKPGILDDADTPRNYQPGRSALQGMDYHFDFEGRRTTIIPRSNLR